MNEERIIPALTRQVLNAKVFSDPGVSKQRIQATAPFWQDAHLGMALSESRWLPWKAASGWKRVN